MSILSMKKILIMSIMLVTMAIGTGFTGGNNGVIIERYEYDSEGKLISRIAPDGGKIASWKVL